MPKYKIADEDGKYTASLTRYLETTLRNLFLDTLRKNKIRSKTEYVENLDTDTRTLVYDSVNESDPFFFENAPLVEVLLRLTEKQRFVIDKHYLDDYTFSEIAELLNIKQQSVSDLHRRALEEFRLQKKEISEFRISKGDKQ